LTNQTPQNKKQSEETNLSIAQFAHLIELNFDDAHDDYIKQKHVNFLFFLLFTYLYLNKLDDNNCFKTKNFVIKYKRHLLIFQLARNIF
jgi:hypothetical protein